MNIKTQRIGVYCGWAFIVTFMIGFLVVAGFVPPPDPAASARTIQRRFQDDTTRIRIGMLICLFSSALLLWWWGAIITQVKRIEGRYSPVTYLQIAGAAAFTIEFVYPLMFWAVAAFRPDDSAELVRKFNDLAWLPFLGIVSTAIVQCIALAVVVIRDQREKPVFPRWFAYFNLWCATLFAPADMIFFFKHGPLAWNGLISFYLVFTIFTAWFVVVTVMTGRAVSAQEADPDPEPPDTAELAAQVAALGSTMAALSEEVQRLRAAEHSVP